MMTKCIAIIIVWLQALALTAQVHIQNISLLYIDSAVVYHGLPNSLHFSDSEHNISGYTYLLNGNTLQCSMMNRHRMLCRDAYVTEGDSAVIEVFRGKNQLHRQVYRVRTVPALSVTLASKPPGTILAADILADPVIRKVHPGYIYDYPYDFSEAVMELETGTDKVAVDILLQVQYGKKLPEKILEMIRNMKSGSILRIRVAYGLQIPGMPGHTRAEYEFRLD